MLAYRGQNGSSNEIECFLPSVSLSTRSVAEAYALRSNIDSPIVESKVLVCTFDINKIFINQPGDCFLDEEDLLRIVPDLDMSSLNVKLAEGFNYNTYQVWHLLDDPTFIDILVSKGYDGAIYMSSGAGAGSPEYRVFDATKIKVIDVITQF